MIISFTVENWMSFRDRASLSMTASLERQHGSRVPKLERYKTRVLPIAAIYGGNASGKTNLFRALSFAKALVVRGTQPEGTIPVEPFRLKAETVELPSRFSFELLIGETIYEFSFAATRKAIKEEKLVEIRSASERVLYNRRADKIEFDRSLAEDMFLDFAFRGTRENQLFLTNSVSQKVDTFKPVYDWFRDKLQLIAPDSRFGPLQECLDEEQPLYGTMNEMLKQLDTGIAHLGGEEVAFDKLSLPEEMKARLQEEVKEGMSARLLNEPNHESFVIARKEGELIAKRVVSYHQAEDGTEEKFEMPRESDGSQRVIELLPAFLDLATETRDVVYVVDELDRSLHTLLTRRLLETYLSSCSAESRRQLLFTTHDVLLMDQRLLRRDEMWVAERDATGASALISFGEYKDIRYDKDIRKSYLQGRMGGIPRILLDGSTLRECVTEESESGA